MNLPGITANASTVTSTELHSQSQSPAALVGQGPNSHLPNDTVSLSAAALKVSAGDGDHDGDSH
jgi:hypothetical protein